MLNQRSLEVGELRIPDPDPIARMQGLRSAQRLLVQVGAVGRSEILDHEDVSLARDSGMTGGGERIIDLDLDLASPQRGSRRRYVVGDAGLMTGCALDQEPWLKAVARRIEARPGGVDARRVGRCRLGSAPLLTAAPHV